MYQTFHPFTGQDMRSIGPSPYANLGLGIAAALYPDPWKIISYSDRMTPGNTPAGHGVTGLGQDSSQMGSGETVLETVSSAPPVLDTTSTISTTGGLCPGCVQVGSNVYNPSSSLNYLVSGDGSPGLNILGSVLGQAGNIAKMVLTPGGSYSVYNPATGQTIQYQGTGQPATGLNIPGFSTTSSLGSFMPLLLIGGGLLVILMAAGHR